LPIKIEKPDEKISSRMANILSWIAAALPASAVVLALLVWNGFLYLEYLRQPPLARPFSHGSFAPVGDDDDWTFKPQFAENAAVSFGSSGASATRYGRIDAKGLTLQTDLYPQLIRKSCLHRKRRGSAGLPGDEL
jgi:hypothetical protein